MRGLTDEERFVLVDNDGQEPEQWEEFILESLVERGLVLRIEEEDWIRWRDGPNMKLALTCDTAARQVSP